MAHRTLVAFAQQVEDADALGQVVVGLSGLADPRMNLAAKPEALTPGAGAFAGVESFADGGQALLRSIWSWMASIAQKILDYFTSITTGILPPSTRIDHSYHWLTWMPYAP